MCIVPRLQLSRGNFAVGKHVGGRLLLSEIGVIVMARTMQQASYDALICGVIVLANVVSANAQQANAPSSKNSSGGKDSVPPKYKIGIFGFGSLIADPGEELANATVSRLEAKTPFAIEYAHSSTHTRSGAPTLVPVKSGGAKVKAIIFVLKDSISDQEAADILYRRETRQIGSGKAYKPPSKPGPNTVLVATAPNVKGVAKVLYTDFPDSGKLVNPTAKQLAELAVGSARSKDVPEGMDGISYLMNAKNAGIITPLTADYEKEILKLTDTASLDDALKKTRGTPLK